MLLKNTLNHPSEEMLASLCPNYALYPFKAGWYKEEAAMLLFSVQKLEAEAKAKDEEIERLQKRLEATQEALRDREQRLGSLLTR